MDQGLFSIGEMARLFHLSVSSIRHDAQIHRLSEAQRAPLGRIELVRVPAYRIFWTENHTTAQEPESLDLSVRQLAAAQTEATIFLGKVGFSISEEFLDSGITNDAEKFVTEICIPVRCE